MINYLIGDATEPQTQDDVNAIIHICNNAGQWGAGFVLALDKKWPEPKRAYLSLINKTKSDTNTLGAIQAVAPCKGVMVVNMIAQDNFVVGQARRCSYLALECCLASLKRSVDTAISECPHTISFHLPRIGTGIGGGDWAVIAPLLEKYLGDYPIYVYDLPQRKASKP